MQKICRNSNLLFSLQSVCKSLQIYLGQKMPYRIRLLGKCPTHSKTSSLKKISIESKTSEHMRKSLTIESVSEGCPDPKTQHENTQKASVQVRYRSLINYWSKRLQKLTFRTKSRSGPPGFHTGFISGCPEGG